MTTPIIIALIAAGVPPLTGLVVYFYQAALAHLPASQQALLTQAAHTAVQAAEQSALTNDGKKRLATTVVNGAMSTWGLKIDPMYVDATIEALVRALKPNIAVLPPGVTPVLPLVGSSDKLYVKEVTQVEQKPIVLPSATT